MTSPLFRTSLWRASPAISTHKLTWNHARVKVPCASVDQPSMSNVEVWRKVLQEPTSRLDFRWGWSPLNVGVPCTVEIKIVLKMWRRKEGTDTLGEHFENWWPYFTNFFEGRCQIFINVYVASSVFGRKTLPEQALLLPMQQDCKTGNLKYMQYVKWHLKIKQKNYKTAQNISLLATTANRSRTRWPTCLFISFLCRVSGTQGYERFILVMLGFVAYADAFVADSNEGARSQE